METAALASATVTISRISSVGMEASYAKTITNEDVLAFAELSGDVNPVHLSDDFAASTIFKKRIAHGFLTGEPVLDRARHQAARARAASISRRA